MDSSPRPSTELFPEALDLSPKQREVLTALQEFPQGAKADLIAQKLHIHINTARGHLEELVHSGLVHAYPAPAGGRGRPSLIYHVRIPDNRTIAHEYIGLISLMISLLATDEELTDYHSSQAHAIGRQWFISMNHPIKQDSPLTVLIHIMSSSGFDPSATPHAVKAHTTNIELHACPFVTAGITPSPFLCAIHSGYLQQLAHTDGRIELNLLPNAGNSSCRIEMTHITD